jgi:D-tyrosyl-tRNA(Tyr) deacylase
MRVVIQRVEQASVTVDDKVVGAIGKGLLVLLGVEAGDTDADLAFIKRKIINLRVFDDGQGRMNLSVRDVAGAILVVSQFTLHGDTRRGNRPDFTRAAPADQARAAYERLIRELRAEGARVESGIFQAMMKVTLTNDGPVTVIVDSNKDFY